MRIRRWAALGIAAMTAGLLAAQASPASAAFKTYTIAKGTATYVAAGHPLFDKTVTTDDAIADLSLPFVVKPYGLSFSLLHVSSNGNVQFGSNPSIEWHNDCLPSASLSGPAIAPYWDDLVLRPNPPSPDGVFWKIYGTNPNRHLAISWRGVDYATGQNAVRFEIIFTQNSSTFSFVYADGNATSATIGVQRAGTSAQATQFACNVGKGNVVLPGEKLTFTYH